MKDAVIVSTARTPIGKAYRGAFNDTEAPVLGGHVIRAALNKVGVAGEDVGDVILGIAAQQGAISTVKSAMQHAIISRSNCLNQHLPHAPTSANHCDADIFSNSTHCGNGA